VKALCDKAEQMVRNGTVLLVLSDRNIAKNRLPVPAPMAVGAVQTRLNKACAAMPTSSLKPPAPAIRTILPCCSALARRLSIRTWPMKRWDV
jgi:glutamate synthase (NADPH/NADH) large chain